MNSIFKDAVVNDKGKISVGDNVVGTGGEATYDPKTGQITIPFNYDFDTNVEKKMTEKSRKKVTKPKFRRNLIKQLEKDSQEIKQPGGDYEV